MFCNINSAIGFCKFVESVCFIPLRTFICGRWITRKNSEFFYSSLLFIEGKRNYILNTYLKLKFVIEYRIIIRLFELYPPFQFSTDKCQFNQEMCLLILLSIGCEFLDTCCLEISIY